LHCALIGVSVEPAMRALTIRWQMIRSQLGLAESEIALDMTNANRDALACAAGAG
jgi:hypothetical protein